MPLVYYAYAAILVGGGAMGFIMAKSPWSLIGSLGFGAVAVVAGLLTRNNAQAGLVIGLVDALAVAGFFAYRYAGTHKAMPAFPSIGLSVLVIALTVAALVALSRNGAAR